MTIQKLGVFGGAKDEDAIIAELREFFASKSIKLDASKDLSTNVKNFATATEELTPTLGEKELEFLMNAIFNLSITLSLDQSLEFNKQLCQIFKGPAFKGTGWNSHAGVAVRILSNIFHLYTDRPETQLLTFKTLTEIAGAAEITKFIDLSLATVEKYIEDWELNVEQKREILRHLHTSLIADKRTNVAFEVMMSLLQTYTEADAGRAKQDARECVRTAIIDLNSFSVDHLLRLSAVQSLQQSDPKIHQLLILFATGKLADYRRFITENATFIRDQLKLDDENALEKKFKMLTLISLAEKQQSLLLTFLAKELEISNPEELEEFLIHAIRIGAVNGKINEQSSEFIVSHFQYRTFGRPQWELLQTRLKSLLKNLQPMQENFKKFVIEEETET